MIAILDYGMGNLRSVEKAVERVGGQAVITAKAKTLEKAEAVILPGVGAFGKAMENLKERRLSGPLSELIGAGKPLLGICLGMQLLFESSEEMGHHDGLGVFGGQAVRFDPIQSARSENGKHIRVPHMGWNQLNIVQASPLLADVPEDAYAYFVHSYYVVPSSRDIILTTTEYGVDFASVVGQDTVHGVQFHPEKSQTVGLTILRNWLAIVRETAR
jgi:glutamine amidotransferase